MATKSPGIYFTEKDNTYYSNPKAAIGTTLAIVGFAKKGPTDKPVEINSWKSFVDTFGNPVNGKYTGLAIKNYLAAGGTVMFKRIADEELAKPSSYIIKNGEPAKAAYAYFNKKGDILSGTPGYNGGSLYGFKVKYGTENTSDIIIRSPKKGIRFTQQAIVKQIDDQLKGVNASYEGSINNVGVDETYSFKLTATAPEKTNKSFSFFTKTSKENVSKKAFVENLSKLIMGYTNSVVEMEVYSDVTGMASSFAIKGNKAFTFKRGEGKEESVSVELEATDTTLSQIVTKINTALKGTDIIALSNNNKITFVDMIEGSNQKLTIGSKDGGLFAKTNGEGGEGNTDFPDASPNQAVFVKICTPKAPEKVEAEAETGKVEVVKSVVFDEVTESIIITANDKFTSIKLEKDVESGAKDLIGESSIIFKELAIEKKNGISGIKVYVDANKQIRLEYTDPNSTDNIELVKHENSSGITISDFCELMGGAEKAIHVSKIEDSQKDAIIITSKEVGSGTSDIAVETISMVNPLDEKDVSRKLLVYSNGLLKETFEDIIVDNNSEDSFDKVINRSVEDGGSYYIKIDIKKNSDGSNIDLPLNEVWKLGQQNKEDDKMFDGIDDNYLNYDYAVGNDGIPEDGGDYLFLRELDPVESDLANKELYDYHIIQTPDNNSSVVQDARIKLCESRGDVFTIIDPPEGLSKKEVIDWHNGIGRDTPIDSNYAAVYWPWCKVFDTTSGKGKYAWVMPSLIMAPQYARVDRTVGSQAAPAGENNGVLPVIDIEKYPSSADRDELYVNYNRINPLVKFKDGTVLAYGEKTTQRKESVLTKIHTRRMLIQIKKQCRAALRGYLFEPNTADYLGKISSNITAILEGYKANGGLNFYKVVCDETNNPVETRQQDIINVDVALVPQGTIEQININLTLNKSEETIAD